MFRERGNLTGRIVKSLVSIHSKFNKSLLSFNRVLFDVLVTTILVIFMFQPWLKDCVVLYKPEELSNYAFRICLVGKSKFHLQGLLFDILVNSLFKRNYSIIQFKRWSSFYSILHSDKCLLMKCHRYQQ